MRLAIIAPGRPAPQGSHNLGGAGQLLDSSSYLKGWRQAVKLAAWRACQERGIRPEQLPLFPAGVPVIIEQLTFYLADDQCRAVGTDAPVGKPDVDKLLRATLDALGGARSPRNHARLYADDSQVVEIRRLSKERSPSGVPGAYIVISDGRD